MATSSLVRRPTWPRLHLAVPGRADLAVLGLCALGAGNVWARRGTGNAVVQPSPQSFVLGVALIAIAGFLCYLASSRPATLPGAALCTIAIALQALLQPAFLLPAPAMYAVGLALAVVPLVRSSRVAWALVLAGTAVNVAAIASVWTWGSAPIDVFTEVQGASAALLHGHDPYGPVFSVFLDQHGTQVTFGQGSFCYGPMVLILSLPARLLGDVRLTAALLNLAILAAAVTWTRRGARDARTVRIVTTLWVASPFVPFMVLNEWTDSFCVAGLAWWLVLRERHRGWATVALTLGMASKPSILVLLVPMLAWFAGIRREVAWSALGTALIAAPFALWTGVTHFIDDTVVSLVDLPVRHDGVTLDGVASMLGRGFIPGGILLAGIVAAVALFSLPRPRGYGGLLSAGSGLLIVVCLFGKQAFLNYYFIAATALLFVVGSGALAPGGELRRPVEALWRGRLRARQSSGTGS